jgi:hypothetical protein
MSSGSIHAVALIGVIHAWMFVILERTVRRNARPAITYGPLFKRGRERIKNLNYIHNNNLDVDDEKIHFYSLVNTFKLRGIAGHGQPSPDDPARKFWAEPGRACTLGRARA